MSSSSLHRKVAFPFYMRFDIIGIQKRFAKGLGWIPEDPNDHIDHRFKLILINHSTHPLSLEGTFKVVFPLCAIVKVQLDFKEMERFNNLLEHLRSLTWHTTELGKLVDFLDRGDFPIVMVVEKIEECSTR